MTDRGRRSFEPVAIALIAALLGGCVAGRRNEAAIYAYYDYAFAESAAMLEPEASRNDEQVLLNLLRLGLAHLAAGQSGPAEHAFGEAFDLLSTAGLNEDRTTAAVLLHEGVRIWKGEPFEQALAYYWVAALYATMGDWENTRAAAANALFRLTDFGADQDDETLARHAAEDENYLTEGYRAVDTNFSLGFLLQAIGTDLSDGGDADPLFDAAVEIDPGLTELVEVLRTRAYNTLLLVDYGKGPVKRAYGPSNALADFVPNERPPGPLVVAIDDWETVRTGPVTDVNLMSVDHRWNNLEDVRRAKAVIGRTLVAGGVIATHVGAHNDSDSTLLAGLAMILVGWLTQSGAQADTRYLEFSPQSIYLVAISLDGPQEVSLWMEDGGGPLVLPNVRPGTSDRPRAIYLRLHGVDSPEPAWLSSRTLVYGNDVTGVRPGDMPWILGGADLATPTPEILASYQESGPLRDLTPLDLRNLYAAEGIYPGPGLHVLLGGDALFTPSPDSLGYKRLYYDEHPPHRVVSTEARDRVRGLER